MLQTQAAEKIKTHILCLITIFFRKSCRLRDNVEKYCTAGQATDVTIWRMRITCWIPKATDTHSEYVILTAFPLQQWLCERASMLRYTYIVLYNFLIYALLFSVQRPSAGLLPLLWERFLWAYHHYLHPL